MEEKKALIEEIIKHLTEAPFEVLEFVYYYLRA